MSRLFVWLCVRACTKLTPHVCPLLYLKLEHPPCLFYHCILWC